MNQIVNIAALFAEDDDGIPVQEEQEYLEEEEAYNLFH
eukprot:CAMPEP_0168334280 /NCGR_PEP_ID=MMETSP0213-20121227/10163_1 /TAXON_ID=151035 /ORGANISM="Euplotes harpa, Strain FSP1.4" /LENGTH=37 /DNA_ID= /DNA_START= /DNA_END= /DNA_ORIENTATION=